MTITSTEYEVFYQGNGTTTAFAIPFRFLSNQDIRVSLFSATEKEKQLEINKDYSIDGAGSKYGGTVSLTRPAESHQKIHVARELPLTQETLWRNHETIDATVLEYNFDKIVMMLQQMAPSLGRAIQVKKDAAELPPILQDPTGNGGKLLMLDQVGREITYYDARAVTTVGNYKKDIVV